MMRRSLALMGCFTAILLVAAEPAPKPASKVPAIPPGQLAGKQEELARLFKQLSGTLLTMADKLEKSSKAEDQEPRQADPPGPRTLREGRGRE